jgi:hypothetical protein
MFPDRYVMWAMHGPTRKKPMLPTVTIVRGPKSPHEAAAQWHTNGWAGGRGMLVRCRLQHTRQSKDSKRKRKVSRVYTMQILNRITSISLRISKSHYACMNIYIMHERPLIQSYEFYLYYYGNLKYIYILCFTTVLA